MHWIFFALIGPFFWASSNFVDKYVLDKYSKGIFDYLFFTAITSWVLFLIILLFHGTPQLTINSLIPLSTGFLLMTSYGFYAKALQKSDTSTLVILFKLVPVFTLLLGWLFLHQTLGIQEFIGFIIVLCGAIYISIERNKLVSFQGLSYILIAIFMWAIVVALVDFGITQMLFWDYLLIENIGSGLFAFTLCLIPSMRREIISGIKTATTHKYLWFNGNNILDFIGQISIKQSLALASSMGLVTIVMQVQSVYAILIGIVLTLLIPKIIREDISKKTLLKKLLGAGVMFAGIYIIFI